MQHQSSDVGVPGRAMVTLYVAATACALSPVLLDLGRHWMEEPLVRYSSLFVPLSVWQLRSASRLEPPRRDGYLWLGMAAVIVVVTVGGGFVRWGRPAIPLASVGLCRLLGGPRPSVALLTLFIVPVPTVVVDSLSPELPRALLALALPMSRLLCGGPAVQTAGLEWQQQAFVVEAGEASLRIDAMDAGLSLVALCAGLGWLAAILRADALPVIRSLRWSALGLPVQLLALSLALVLLELGAARLAEGLLVHAAWLCTAGVGVWAAAKGGSDGS
jgi:hypothetical protein